MMELASDQIGRLAVVANWIVLFGVVLSPAPIGWAWVANDEAWPAGRDWLSLASVTVYVSAVVTALVWRSWAFVTWGI